MSVARLVDATVEAVGSAKPRIVPTLALPVGHLYSEGFYFLVVYPGHHPVAGGRQNVAAGEWKVEQT